MPNHVSEDTLACLLAVAFILGASAGGAGIGLLYWRKKIVAFHTEVLRLRQLADEMTRRFGAAPIIPDNGEQSMNDTLVPKGNARDLDQACADYLTHDEQTLVKLARTGPNLKFTTFILDALTDKPMTAPEIAKEILRCAKLALRPENKA